MEYYEKTKPLIGLEETLQAAQQMIKEGLLAHAALFLTRLAREASQAAEDIGEATTNEVIAQLRAADAGAFEAPAGSLARRNEEGL